ncbi:MULTISPECIES: D-aminoacyl-tRNA deacylase [Acetoanaerobium]|uniref:D-aminoacyl-tRNA deacylase n=1 Tax=Acetoanaerobium sticklandii (strain ATCC 12662 / DSM 519 / JCM 1433 / CCUG 9281 / NCIMB 10654 / HF) TaxID=499177 RepID=E3PYA9_ACESD|nr:D-aminoacyl-tRNA deacylase [Acetoanaerobium sticklandii]MBP8762969.1 D-tyrosyl-tRNA(Tyr) deacylase [Acetoanaerobium sp.]CBH21424.1 D-tyrosyl-tRNA(Tyr) deacylase [Acetoanaerobium sticklandii]
MRAVVQRVKKASVKIQNTSDGDYINGEIDKGLLVFLGITHEDNDKDLDYIADKISGLRIFEDEQGKMNLSIDDIKGEILLISQFTLYGDCRKGRRPGFTDAARPEIAIPLYEKMIDTLKLKGIKVEVGIFGADMLVDIQNDGPVTILLDSSKLF